jgi:hypothetical protein
VAPNPSWKFTCGGTEAIKNGGKVECLRRNSGLDLTILRDGSIVLKVISAVFRISK